MSDTTELDLAHRCDHCCGSGHDPNLMGEACVRCWGSGLYECSMAKALAAKVRDLEARNAELERKGLCAECRCWNMHRTYCSQNPLQQRAEAAETRVKVLEEALEHYEMASKAAANAAERDEVTLARFRTALEFYADPRNWCPNKPDWDHSDLARQTLQAAPCGEETRK